MDMAKPLAVVIRVLVLAQVIPFGQASKEAKCLFIVNYPNVDLTGLGFNPRLQLSMSAI
jgi:hypothetical protein